MQIWEYFTRLFIRKSLLRKKMQSQLDTQPIDTQGLEESQSQAPIAEPEVFACLIPDMSNYRFAEIRSHEFSIGRHGCDFEVTAEQCGEKSLKFISKRQCVIRVISVDEDGVHFKLENVGTNASFVNGVKIKKGTTILLGHNDTLSFGKPWWKAWKFNCNRERWTTHPEEVSSKYIVTGEIGSGAHGIVFKAFNKMTSHAVALKVLKMSKVSATGLVKEKDMANEINVMKKLNHPNVVRILDVISCSVSTSVYLAIEYVQGGDLFVRLQKGKMTEATAKHINYQIALAVQYLHSKDITHRDIKPENILLDSDAEEPLAKLTDFGLSKYAPIDVTNLKTFCGTLNYVAPEILRSNGKTYTPKVDVWSLGVVLYVCLAGYPPFSEEYSGRNVSDQILKGDLHMSQKHWSNINKDAQWLVRRMLTVAPAKRITIGGPAGVLQNIWFSGDKPLKKKYQKLVESVQVIDASRIDMPRLVNQATASVSSEEGGEVSRTSKRKNEDEKENEVKRLRVNFFK